MGILGVKPAVFGFVSSLSTRVANDACSSLLLSRESVVVRIVSVDILVNVLVI